MDHLDYGLSEPKLALLPNGDVFVAGQIQAPMDPPPASTQSNGLRMMAAANVTYQGSTILGIINGAKVSNSMSINQGTERLVNTLGLHNSEDGNAPSMAWKDLLPGIANRKALVTGNCVSTQPIDDAAFQKLKGKLTTFASGGAKISEKTLTLNRVTYVFGLFSSKTKFTFETVLDVAETPPGGTIQLELDSDGAVFGKQTYDYNPQWTLSQAFTVNVAPVTYVPSGSTTPIVMDSTQLSAYASTLETAMYNYYPISSGQLHVITNSSLGVTWDENPGPSGTTPAWPNYQAGVSLAASKDANNKSDGWLKLNIGFKDFINSIQPASGNLPPNTYYVGVMPSIPNYNFPDPNQTLGTTLFAPSTKEQYHYSIVTYGSYSSGTISATPPSFLTVPKDLETSLHEVGHAHGAMHTGLGGSATPDPKFPYSGKNIGVPGWNWMTGTKFPSSTYDIMGYSKSNEWPSDYTFCIWFQHELNVGTNYDSIPH
jgi:hypothetical protein